MKLLIDSHVYLWLLFAPESLGREALRALDDADEVLLSTVSLWELTLKSAKGKLPHDATELMAGVAALGVRELPIEHRHLLALPNVALPHRDPFDAMLVAQASVDQSCLLTADGYLLGSEYTTLDARS
ncbi:MAG: type II toxin-antitoxin system VapC family toxin [Propioniciclava sp.]|uniref:type II toxin-antitoxin system VapC family toxin n=1 Tax=Propioniciclava sp. TaxID=2038686 RepID=UPI0039E337E4